jgi:hypothetical protein
VGRRRLRLFWPAVRGVLGGWSGDVIMNVVLQKNYSTRTFGTEGRFGDWDDFCVIPSSIV